MAWFESRGVKLKTEKDGRIFPITDSSQTIIDCLVESAIRGGVVFRKNEVVAGAVSSINGVFEVLLSSSEKISCDRLLLATGGCRVPAAGGLAKIFGHSLTPPVPSLFTFELNSHWLQTLPGVALEAELRVAHKGLRERGPVLLTHRGLSGPAVLRLSAWGARTLHERNYRFVLRVNWIPNVTAEQLMTEFVSRRRTQPARFVVNAPVLPLPARFWEAVVVASGIPRETRWADLSRAAQHVLTQQLIASDVEVIGKSLNKDEFVTCGGVSLREVNFATMESRICPGLYFAGELLDIDGLTGGFNFQAAWTTGWIAGRAMAGNG